MVNRKMSKGVKCQYRSSTSWFKPGADGNRILVVFECPGDNELALGRPLAGATGAHMCMLCDSLRKVIGRESLLFEYREQFCTECITVLNVAKKRLGSWRLKKEEERKLAFDFITRREVVYAISHAAVIMLFGRLAWLMRDIVLYVQKQGKEDCLPVIGCPHLSGVNHAKFCNGTWSKRMNDLGNKIVDAMSCDDGSEWRDLTGFKQVKHVEMVDELKEKIKLLLA